MGGQACVLYGAAEFSRDTDLAVLADPQNLDRLRSALDELQAECIAVPPFRAEFLEMGLAVHFRCRHPEAERMRVDVMSRMRGVEEFSVLWDRRTTLPLEAVAIEALSLPDLVRAKKTQRDKDWPMIARLVEVNYFRNREAPTPEQIAFWLRELRTPELLIEVAARFTAEARQFSAQRPLLESALQKDEALLQQALKEEESVERAADRAYWEPLRRTLEQLRHAGKPSP